MQSAGAPSRRAAVRAFLNEWASDLAMSPRVLSDWEHTHGTALVARSQGSGSDTVFLAPTLVASSLLSATVVCPAKGLAVLEA